MFIGILIIVGIACAVSFCSGSYRVFSAVYIACFLFLFACTVISYSSLSEKIVQSVILALITVSQIVINSLVIRPMEGDVRAVYLSRLLGAAFIFLPFLSERIFFHGRTAEMPVASEDNPLVLSYSQFLRDGKTISYNLKKMKKAGKVISKGYLTDMITDIPRHSVYHYISRESLPEEYFAKATESLGDGYIYLVITRSLSPASEVIGVFTDKRYNHVSISFDSELETIVSYNGGENIAPPGLNPELVRQLVSKDGSSIMLYRLPATCEQKQKMLDTVRRINTEGSAYNVLGMMLKLPARPNIMFCSQFACTLLNAADLNYIDKDPIRVKPTDFIELDYYRRLEFITEINSDSYGI